MEKQRSYLHPISLDDVLERGVPLSSDSHMKNQSNLQEQVAQREVVRQALAQLRSEQRRVIALRYGADLTEVDIAQVLGWPIGTVKSRLNRARERLRELLQDGER
jgi:RNA polymerase sigma-70 factor (ECF subfamily)